MQVELRLNFHKYTILNEFKNEIKNQNVYDLLVFLHIFLVNIVIAKLAFVQA